MSCVSLASFSAHTWYGLIWGQADKDLEKKGPPNLQGKSETHGVLIVPSGSDGSPKSLVTHSPEGEY